MKSKHHTQWTKMIIPTIFSLQRMSFRHKNTISTNRLKGFIFSTYTMYILIEPFFTLETLSRAFLKCLSFKIHSHQFYTTKPNMRNVQNSIFYFFHKSLTNPYIYWHYSDWKNCTVVRNTVQFLYSFDEAQIYNKYHLNERLSLSKNAFNVNVLCTFS